MTKPEKVFKAGNCQASVFMHEIQKGDKKIKVPNVSFQKRYRDEKGNWQGTGNLGINDVPKAVFVLEEAYKWCLSANKNIETEEEAEETGDD